MKSEDVLHECLKLIWNFGECYYSNDIYNFQRKNLRTRTDYYKVKNYFKQMQQSVKALDEIEEFCTLDCDSHDAYETVYKQILDIINNAKRRSND